jgi:hypothetical protein
MRRRTAAKSGTRSSADKSRARVAPPRRRRRSTTAGGEAGHVIEFMDQVREHHETSPRVTGGDVDADWQNALGAGDEAVGGSTATPDQDVVDEIGEALGVPQAPDAEFRPVAEILAERDRRRWRLEDEATGSTKDDA